MAKYRCSYCKQIIKRVSSKKWITSCCTEKVMKEKNSDGLVRLIRIK